MFYCVSAMCNPLQVIQHQTFVLIERIAFMHGKCLALHKKIAYVRLVAQLLSKPRVHKHQDS